MQQTNNPKIQRQMSRRSGLIKIATFQLVLLISMFIVCTIMLGKVAAYSALAGGLCSMIPHLYFAYRMLFLSPNSNPQVILKGFFRIEIIKFILSIAMFGLCVAVIQPMDLLMLVVGYIILQLSVIFVPLLVKHNI